MLQGFVITLREGLEAFLIVAVTLTYLRRTGGAHLVRAGHWGIAASVLVSGVAGMLFERAANQALWKGVLAIAAAVLVGSLLVHIWRAAKTIKRDIEQRLEASAMKPAKAEFIGVFLFTVVMITRGGMEMVFVLHAALFQVQSALVFTGAVGGMVAAATVAWLWSKYGHRVNLARFFQVTALFLSVFLVQLLVYGFHELTEANVLPYSEPLHWATEPYGPDGRYGQLLVYLLVLLPLGWLALTSLWGQKDARAEE
jgi:high-affinity iron transporter